MSEPGYRPETPTAPLVEGVEMVKLAVEGWKKTVEVQQHFNDLELRIRNFAITFTAAVLGLVGWALKEGVDSFLPTGLLAIGTLGWVAFYLMDRHWYHRYLDAAVEHGRRIENWLIGATGTQVFSLATGIKKASGIHLAKQPQGLWRWCVGLFVKKHELRSHHRINLFYGAFMLAFAGLTTAFYLHTAKPSTATNRTRDNVPRAGAPVMSASPKQAFVSSGSTRVGEEGASAASEAPVCRSER
jgi:hypothetical protein